MSLLSVNPKKILIRTPNWLGDLMMSMSFVQKVLELYPNARVDLMVKQGFEALPLPRRGKIIPFNKKTQALAQMAKDLRAEAYDAAFILPPSFSSAWMMARAKIPFRAGVAHFPRSFLLKPAVDCPWPFRSRHLTDEYARLLGLDSFEPSAAGLSLEPSWIKAQLETLPKLPDAFFIIAPGAEYGPAKQWPLASYAKLVQALEQRSITTLMVGTQKDRGSLKLTKDQAPNFMDLSGTTSLNQLLALLAQAKLVISNDSGAMHIAAGLARPQIALFGSTSSLWTGPLNPAAQVLHAGLDCSPCFKRRCPYGHYDCLKAITVDMVLDKIDLRYKKASI